MMAMRNSQSDVRQIGLFFSVNDAGKVMIHSINFN